MNRSSVTSLISLAILILLVAAPGVASACPQCAANQRGGVGAGVLLGSMIVLPFPLVWFVIRLIRKNDDRGGAAQARGPASPGRDASN